MQLLKSHTWVLFIITCLVYANTLTLDYALDDALVITGNQFTKQGIDGIDDIFTNEFFTGFFGTKKELVAGGRYRPLSLAMFAIEYEFFGKAPALSHAINVLLYAFTVVLLYKVLMLLFNPAEDKKWFHSIPFLSALIFALHPLHTEVVANIKGRDEILTLLFAFGALYTSIKYVLASGKEKLYWLAGSFAVFSLGLFSKENCITFLTVIPIALYFFKGQTIKKSLSSTVPLLLATVVFLYVRSQVLGGFSNIQSTELMNDPFLGTTTAEKYATILYTWFLYLKLIIFPHPLTYDYYPYHIAITNFADWKVWTAILTFGGVALLSLKYFIQSFNNLDSLSENTKIYTWSAIIFFSSFSVVSNLLFPIGAFMNERFLYLPTVAIAIAGATGIYSLLSKPYGKYVQIAVLVIMIAYSGKSMHRNLAWQDDFTLFTTDVKTSYNSAKSTCSAGGKLLERAKDEQYVSFRDEYLDLSLQYLRKSISIHPKYVEALLLLGNCHFEFEAYDSTLYYYRKLVNYAPSHEKVYDNLQIVLNKVEDIDKQLAICHDFHKVNSINYDLNYKLGVIYGKHKGNLQQSIFYLERAIKIDSKKKEALKDLGVAYGIAQRPEEAEKVLKLAIKADPKDGQTYFNLGVTYQNMGRMEDAQNLFKQAGEIDPKFLPKQPATK